MNATHSSISPPPAATRTSRWQAGFRAKLYGLVAIAALLMIALQTYSVVLSYHDKLEAKTTEIQSVMQTALGILKRYATLAEQGKMSREDAERAAYDALRGMRYGENDDYVFAWRISDAITMVHGIASQEGQYQFNIGTDKRPKDVIVADRLGVLRKAGGQALARVTQTRAGMPDPLPKQNINALFEPWGVVVGTGVFLDRVEAEFRADLIERVVTSVLVILVLVLGGIWIVRGVMRQLGGEPTGAVLVMQQAAGGDFTQGSQLGTGRVPAGSLLAAFGDMSASVRGMIVNVRDEAGALREDATRLSESVHQVSKASTHQSEATASMAAAIEELTVSVSHISEAARDTEQLSEDVASLCRSSEGQVNSASEGMERIATAVGDASTKIAGLQTRAEQISVIAASIKEIASQTNLLALNAAIEAARAGEQGRGFSVVADEVRKLAERTASATVEIEQMVNAVQTETRESTITMDRVRPIVDEGTAFTRQVADSLREIRQRADMSLERVREVAHATREQSSASTSIAQRVEGIAQMVEETNATMEETARSASDMRDMSVRLDSLVGAFKV
ncbi:methyl-accepting chemotaxis protein [Pigmentiphaga aceris]|nr:methyl-accepting chemotaxis protein [Pigmentiphaga aceris]